MSEQETGRPLPLPVLVQPDPMLEQSAGPFRTILAGLGGAFVVILVLYGLSRPPEPQVMASAPEAASQAAPAGQQTPPPSTNGKPDAKQGNAQPSTTGQGGSDNSQPKQGPAATPGDKPAPAK